MTILVRYINSAHHRLRAAFLDRRSLREFGISAPRYAQQVLIPVSDLKSQIASPISRSKSGRVMKQNWNPKTFPLFENPKIKYCLARWRDGESWENSGAIDFHMNAIDQHGVIDHCKTRDDVDERLRALDVIWQDVVKAGKLESAFHTSNHGFREAGGVLVHLGPDCHPIFGGGGNHRLGIALAAELETATCQLGAVHPSALGALQSLTTTTAERDLD